MFITVTDLAKSYRNETLDKPTTVKERPILFTGEMVKAVLSGEKTQTRRIIKPQPHQWHNGDITFKAGKYLLGSTVPERKIQTELYKEDIAKACKYGMTGDRLWVKEALAKRYKSFFGETAYYQCGGATVYHDYVTQQWQWKRDTLPAIFCPRWASRITLEITGIRVERVQDTTESDARAEGVKDKAAYQVLWDNINAKRGYSWQDNPWVWVVEFRKVEPV